MQKAIDKQWVELITFPHTNTIMFMIAYIVLIYCPFCGEYLPETSDSLTVKMVESNVKNDACLPYLRHKQA